EVGIRKSLGALRKQLVIQFIIESVIFNIVAAVLAIGLAYLLLPVLNQVFGKELAFDLIQLPAFWLLFIAVVLSGSILSGLYPALVLSGFKPISMLKGYRRSGKTTVLRQGLIVFQFVMSLLLLSATYLLVKQTSFMKNQDLGINLDKILIVSGPRATSDKDKSIEKFQTFRNELARHSSIHAVTGSLCVPGQFWMGAKRRPETAIENAPISRGFYVTLNFENTYDLEFLAGSPFRETMSDEEVNIINEAALSTLGFETPEDAIGQKIVDNDEERPKTIVGVVKNFHWHSLHEGHMPYILGLYENRLTENISIKLSTETLPETLEHIEATFSDFFPGNPFDYYFADTAFNNEYRAEDQFKEIFLCFTLLAIVIACVGLLALVSHSLSMKVKEIGIRKVLGAGIPGLMLLLSKEYMRLIFWAMLLSFPLVWYFGSDWLENYSYRISITFDLFIYPFMILVLITLLTISRRTFLASRTNPVDSLRMD
ncbi:MAG: FtsX-like permease family protein, partial [Bacteroidota bacterium]